MMIFQKPRHAHSVILWINCHRNNQLKCMQNLSHRINSSIFFSKSQGEKKKPTDKGADKSQIKERLSTADLHATLFKNDCFHKSSASLSKSLESRDSGTEGAYRTVVSQDNTQTFPPPSTSCRAYYR